MWEAFEGPYENFDANLVKTHNTEPPTLRLNDPSEVSCPLTWPGREFDQKGTTPSVEQGHCTLIAVKRYRDPPRIGGRHNFLLRPRLVTNNEKIKFSKNIILRVCYVVGRTRMLFCAREIGCTH